MIAVLSGILCSCEVTLLLYNARNYWLLNERLNQRLSGNKKIINIYHRWWRIGKVVKCDQVFLKLGQ